MKSRRKRPRLAIELEPKEVRIKNRARAKALSEGVTLRDVIIDALAAYTA